MRILFWGTPTYAVPTLVALSEAGHQIVGVVTQPDRRRGRGKEVVPSPVKQEAVKRGLPVFTPERIRSDQACQHQLAALNAEIFIVVAFGQILPASVLEIPALGCWNGHGSLLPRWRGAGPIQWSILAGDTETGVGVMAMEQGLDTGPVLLEERCLIGLLDNADQLAQRLSQLTAELMLKALPRIEAAGPGPETERLARLKPRLQLEESTYARMLKKEDFVLHWSDPALTLHRKVMGLYPGAHTQWKTKRLKITATEPLIERLQQHLTPEAAALVGRWGTGTDQPGTILGVINELGIVVSSSGCPLLIREGQLEGKARRGGQTLIQQLGASIGDRLGSADQSSV